MTAHQDSPPPVSARERAVAFGLLLVAFLAIHGSLLWGGTAAVGGDLATNLIPMTVSWLTHGPWWMPGTFSGHPLLADPQSALLYPPTWLHALAGAERVPSTFAVLVSLHMLVSAVGMREFARRFVGPEGALLAALVWMLGGSYGSRIVPGIAVFTHAMAWMPWMLLALERAMNLRTLLPGTAMLGLCGGMQVLAGAPQVAQITWVGLGVWAAARLLAERPASRVYRSVALALVAAGALALLIASPQLVETARYLGLAWPRGAGDRWAFVISDSIDGRHLMTWVWPHLFLPGNSPFYWGSSSWFFETTAYVGILPLALAVVAVALRHGHHDRFPFGPAAVLSVFGFLMALGGNGPLLRILFESVPTFDMFRVPARWAVWFTIGVSLLAARALDVLVTAAREPATERRACAVGFGVLAAATVAAYVMKDALLEDGLEIGRAWAAAEHLEEMFRSATSALTLGAGLAVLGGVVTALMLWGRLGRRVWVVLLLGFCLVDFRLFWQPFLAPYPLQVPPWQVIEVEQFHRLQPPDAFDRAFLPQREMLDAVRRESPGRTLALVDTQFWDTDQYNRELLMELPALAGIESVRGYQQIILKKYAEEIGRVGGGYAEGETVVPFLPVGRVADRTMLDAYNVTGVATYFDPARVAEIERAGLTRAAQLNAKGLVLFGNPHARGWGWLSPAGETAWPGASVLRAETAWLTVERGDGRESYFGTIDNEGGAVLHVSSPEYPAWTWEGLPAGAEVLSSRSVRLPVGAFAVSRAYRPVGAFWPLLALASSVALVLIFLSLRRCPERNRTGADECVGHVDRTDDRV